MSERLPDIYFTRDFPVLAEIGRWEAAGRTDRFLRPESIAENMGRPVEEVIQSVGRLFHAGLVDAADATTFGGEDYIVRRLTGAGLQESGLWPREEDEAAALTKALEREIEAARNDPDRRRKLELVVDTLKEVGPVVIGRVVEAVLKAYGVGL